MTQSRFLEAPLIRQADGELKKILPKICEFEVPKGFIYHLAVQIC